MLNTPFRGRTRYLQLHQLLQVKYTLGWEFRAEFRRIPENFRFRTLFRPNVFRFRFRFRSDYVFPPNFSLSEFCSRQFFSEFFHRKISPAISAGMVMACAKRTSTGIMADNLHVASRVLLAGAKKARSNAMPRQPNPLHH